MNLRPKIEVFLSYAKLDEDAARDLWGRLAVQLAVSGRYEFTTWQFLDAILPGDDFHQEIIAALERSAIGVFALSAPFLASSYIADHELPAFVNAAGPAAGPSTGHVAGKRAVPVMLGHFDVRTAKLRGLEPLQVYAKDRPYAALRRAADKDQWAADLATAIHRIAGARLGIAPAV